MNAAFLFLIGATVGGYGTIIGAGGGFLLVPLLLAMFPAANVTMVTSLSLSVVAVNAFSGTLAYAYQRRIDYRLAVTLAAVTVPGAMLGAAVTGFIPRALFETVFGITLIVLAATLIHRPTRGARVLASAAPEGKRIDARRFQLGLALSGAVGWLGGVLGIGGAPPQVVVLTHVMHVPVARAMPTVQFLVLFSALGAVAIHVGAGDFGASPMWTLWLGAGALAGAQVGAAISGRLSGAALVRLLAAALLAVGVGLLVKAAR
ncbi:MAG: sulfite exporter TauE/SafE family protein [Candidatus Rokubacteria bacterium]|nr:sulfite exporter TauE/SafE family protein [Candidatus Rokubacteria bacterium]